MARGVTVTSVTASSVVATATTGQPVCHVAPAKIAKTASTGREKRNSTPLLRTMRLTQIERGIAVDLTRRASLLKARVKSVTAELKAASSTRALLR